ncbi:hypothetical protein [Sphingobacterium hungaricum]|nr:hypothetical protein [Sphingobacterium hungaricum]
MNVFSGCEPEDDGADIVPEAKVVGKYKHTQSGVIIDVRYNLGVTPKR